MDDPRTATCRLLLLSGDSRDGAPRWAGERQRTALDAAHKVFTEDGPQRWELEARLIAGQADPRSPSVPG